MPFWRKGASLPSLRREAPEAASGGGRALVARKRHAETSLHRGARRSGERPGGGRKRSPGRGLRCAVQLHSIPCRSEGGGRRARHPGLRSRSCPWRSCPRPGGARPHRPSAGVHPILAGLCPPRDHAGADRAGAEGALTAPFSLAGARAQFRGPGGLFARHLGDRVEFRGAMRDFPGDPEPRHACLWEPAARFLPR